jgi:hypothetical protein
VFKRWCGCGARAQPAPIAPAQVGFAQS